MDYVEYRIVRKDGSIRWLEDYGHFVRSESLGDIFYVFVGDATEKRHNYLSKHNLLLQENTQKEEELKNLIAKYTNERKQINQEHLRRLEVIEGLSVNYESILYADLDSDEIFAYRLSYRTARQFDEIHQVRSFAWYISDYIETWVHPEDCQLVNISTGGCCVESEYVHSEDEVVRIRIKLEEYSPFNHIGQIVRCTERNGKFQYGILFAQLTEQEITSLNRMLFNLQMGMRQTLMKAEEGHWEGDPAVLEAERKR